MTEKKRNKPKPKLRVSQYVIQTPMRKDENKFILAHGYTGALDIVDREIASLLKPGTANGSLSQLSAEIKRQLTARGYLTVMSAEEEREHVARIVESVYSYYRQSLSVLIAPNLDCSFRCRYCFQRSLQNEITHHPSNPLASVITKKKIDKIFDILKEKKNDANTRLNSNITLYGGEALQSANLEAVSYIVERGKELELTFSAISNGYEIDLFYHLLGATGIKKLQITIDGPKEIHDKMRIERNGRSTFDKIISNINGALGRGCEINISVNFDEQNVQALPNLFRQFKDLGWLDHPDIVIHGNQIFDLKTNLTAFQENYDSLQEIREFALQNNILLSNSTTKIQDLFLRRIGNDEPLSLKPVYCSANTGMYIFGPDGKIYTCWEAVGDSLSCVGSYDPEFKLDQDNLERWHNRVANRIDACHKCEYIMFCGGGCTINAYRKNGQFLSPYCDSFDRKFHDLMKSVVSKTHELIEQELFNDRSSKIHQSDNQLISLNNAFVIDRSTELSQDLISFMVGAEKNYDNGKMERGENWLCNFH
ncbi:MAG: radical SAM protein [Xenococcus sp. (in: cyanobacteria)]